MKSKSNERTHLLNDGLQKESSLPATKTLPFFKLFTYSSSLEKIVIVLGAFFTIIAGVAYSFFAISLGNATSVIVSYVQRTDKNVSVHEKERADQELYDGVMEFVIVNVSLAAVIMVCTFLGNLIFNYTAYSQTFRIKDLFLGSVLNQDIGWHDVNETGEFSTRITEDLKKLEEGIGEKVTMFLYYCTVSLFSLLQAFNLGWELTLVSMLSLPLSALAMAFVSYITSKLALKETDAYGEAGALAEEVFTSLRTVVAFGGEKVEARSYDIFLKFARDNNIKRALFTGLGEAITWLLFFSNYGISYWYGINLLINDRALPPYEVTYDGGTVVSIFCSVFSALIYFSMLSTFLEIFSVAKSCASKIYPLIENRPVINLSKGHGQRYKKVEGKIEFENVHFEYPSRKDVKILRGLDLVINPGETVALVGSSGCGKSTCIQLIQRYYDPTAGHVFIDDCRLEDLDLTWFRNCVGVVGQEPVLFEGTVAENIRMGCKIASIQDVEQAAKKANAHGFITALPQGYDTLVGERGTQLSGGQKQRIAIARALVRKPSILLLDEATSALDTSSEEVVQAALEQASTECTTIIVAHRLSTVKRANRIVVISEGAVEEQGTHDELMVKKGSYYVLVTAQVSEDQTLKEDSLPPLIESQLIDSDRKDSVELSPSKRSSQEAAYIGGIMKEEKGFFTLVGEVLRYNSSEWWAIAIACTCSCMLGMTMPVYAVILGNFIGTFAREDNDYLLSQVGMYATASISIGVVLFIATLLQSYFFGFSGETLTMRLRSNMFKCLLAQDMSYFDNKDHSVGSICGLLAAEAASVQGATGLRIGVILSALATAISALVISFYYEWRITLVVMCFTPIIILVTISENKIIVKESRDLHQSLQLSTKIAVEAVNGIRTVAALGCEDFFHKAYIAEIIPIHKLALKNTHIRGLVYSLNRTIMLFAYAAAFYYGVTLIRDEALDYSLMYIVTITVIASSWAFAKGFVFTPNLQKGLIAAGRIIDLIKRKPLVTSGPRDHYEKWQTTDVKYDNIHFSYPTRPKVKVLRGLKLSVEQGQTVALVGPSGCGKSTIVQLLERFYDPVFGTISVGNVPINTMNLVSLRSQLGVVSQEPNLFNRTIADNIAYGDNNRFVTDHQIMEAAKNANIHDFIVSLPMGYSTKLGDKGTQLSGGQKQRVAIARALVRNPRILLLDEATSALDAESEKVVQEALDKARMGRTCITIAHRLSTIQDADVICVISRGTIAEIGTHQELLELRKLYYDLHRLQQ